MVEVVLNIKIKNIELIKNVMRCLYGIFLIKIKIIKGINSVIIIPSPRQLQQIPNKNPI